MNRLYSRNVGGVLLFLAVGLLWWALDLRDSNVLQMQSLQSLQSQAARMQARGAGGGTDDAAQAPALAQRASAWREAARPRGSDARHTALVLDVVRAACESSGLKECQVRRASATGARGAASPAAGASSAGSSVRWASHPVNVLARFDAAGVEEFGRRLRASGYLFREERVNVALNRAEWDLVFLFQAAQGGAASVVAKGASNAKGSAPGLRVWEAAPANPPEAAGAKRPKPLTPDFWKIAGVYESAEGRRAIVEYAPPRASEYLKVGAPLPNGAQILAIDKGSVTVKAKVANQWKTIVLEF